MALIGSFFTDYSAINSVLGLCFCLWGLNSQLKILNLAGLLLCGIALAICIAF